MVLGVKDEAELTRELARLDPLLTTLPWREDDLGNQLTAASSAPVSDPALRRHFRHMGLLK